MRTPRRRVLFVGFSLTDDSFLRIVHDVRQALPADQAERRAFGTALMLEHDPRIGLCCWGAGLRGHGDASSGAAP